MRDRARNSIQGRKANAAGDMHEAWMDVQHQLALQLGILVRIDKIDPPAVMRKGRVEFGERTGADYIGMLGERRGNHEKYLACEAKSTQEERLYKNEVKPHQQKHLDTIAAGGRLALLVVEFRYPITTESAVLSFFNGKTFGLYRRYACPWVQTPWATIRTSPSVSESDLVSGGWLVEEGKCYLERFHPRGTPVPQAVGGKQRLYARE